MQRRLEAFADIFRLLAPLVKLPFPVQPFISYLVVTQQIKTEVALVKVRQVFIFRLQLRTGSPKMASAS